MGAIKKEIKSLSKDAGSLAAARKKAHAWFSAGKLNRKEKGVASTGQRFRPGKIYVFEYKTPKGIDTLEWWDQNPVVLALDPYNGNDVGINLNLLPNEVREELLDFVYDKMKGQIKSQSMGSRSGDALNQGQLKFTYDGARLFLKQYGYDFAIRQYIPNLKSKQAVVSYENWARIAICDFIDLNGTTVREIQEMFRKHIR